MLASGITYTKLYIYNQKLYSLTLLSQVWDFHSHVICLYAGTCIHSTFPIYPGCGSAAQRYTASLLWFGAHCSIAESYV